MNRKLVTPLALLAVCVFTARPAAAGDAPAKGVQWHIPRAAHMMTSWGRLVTPENAHREYPRPQLARKEWMNLNGLWQYAEARPGEAPPTGRDLSLIHI